MYTYIHLCVYVCVQMYVCVQHKLVVCVHVCALLRCASLCVLCMCATVLRLSLRMCVHAHSCVLCMYYRSMVVLCVQRMCASFFTVPLYLAARERTPAHVDYLLLHSVPLCTTYLLVHCTSYYLLLCIVQCTTTCMYSIVYYYMYVQYSVHVCMCIHIVLCCCVCVSLCVCTQLCAWLSAYPLVHSLVPASWGCISIGKTFTPCSATCLTMRGKTEVSLLPPHSPCSTHTTVYTHHHYLSSSVVLTVQHIPGCLSIDKMHNYLVIFLCRIVYCGNQGRAARPRPQEGLCYTLCISVMFVIVCYIVPHQLMLLVIVCMLHVVYA